MRMPERYQRNKLLLLTPFSVTNKFQISSTEGEGTVMEVYMAKKINLDNNSR